MHCKEERNHEENSVRREGRMEWKNAAERARPAVVGREVARGVTDGLCACSVTHAHYYCFFFLFLSHSLTLFSSHSFSHSLTLSLALYPPAPAITSSSGKNSKWVLTSFERDGGPHRCAVPFGNARPANREPTADTPRPADGG